MQQQQQRTSADSSRSSLAGDQAVNTDYLKNVFLQLLEQKEKRTQMQLVPVLGMLLKFDRRDEQKWTAAVAALRNS